MLQWTDFISLFLQFLEGTQAVFILRASWTCRCSWDAPFSWLVLHTGNSSYSQELHSTISLTSELCRYGTGPMLSAGSFPDWGPELQGLNRHDQCLLEAFSLILSGRGRFHRMKGQLCAKQKGSCAERICGLCLWELSEWVSTGLVNIPKLSDPSVPQRFDMICLGFFYSFIQWFSVQKVQQVVTEFLPNSWGARQVGRSFP